MGRWVGAGSCDLSVMGGGCIVASPASGHFKSGGSQERKSARQTDQMPAWLVLVGVIVGMLGAIMMDLGTGQSGVSGDQP
jgi:hypothetical protein